MSKYSPLGAHLRRTGRSKVPMSFAEIERVLGFKLPDSSRYRAWWSNNPFNSVMTKVWLDAGYKTEQVDMRGGHVLFVRAEGDGERRDRRDEEARSVHPAWGALKGTSVVSKDTDLTRPAEPEWEKLYDR